MPPNNFLPKKIKALKDATCDKGIKALLAYKDKATVVMNRVDSDNKMLRMQNDENIYLHVRKDPTVSFDSVVTLGSDTKIVLTVCSYLVVLRFGDMPSPGYMCVSFHDCVLQGSVQS